MNQQTNEPTKEPNNQTTKLPNNQPINPQTTPLHLSSRWCFVEILIWIQTMFWKETLTSGCTMAYAIKPTLRSLFAWKLTLNLNHLRLCNYNLGEGRNSVPFHIEKSPLANGDQRHLRLFYDLPLCVCLLTVSSQFPKLPVWIMQGKLCNVWSQERLY